VYHGSVATHDWLPKIFGTLDTCTTLLTLVTSLGHSSTPPGAISGDLSSLTALPLTVETYLSLGAIFSPVPCGTPWSPDKPHSPRTRPLSLSFEGSHTTHVYL